MADETCGEEHPQEPGVTCEKATHPFGTHYSASAGLVWGGTPAPQRSRRGSAGRVLDVVHAMEDRGAGARTGPPVSGTVSALGQAARTWAQEQEAWLALARAALKQVCQTHETFTNEAVWALVPDPRERRAMVLVTRYGLRTGWMHEDHAVRIKGVWVTQDGHEFPLNKLVPVYRSDLFGK